MIALLITALLVAQAQRPSVPSGIAIRDASPSSTVSSGRDAYITWTVDPTTSGMVYDISIDDGPWVQPTTLEEIPLSPDEAAKFRMYGVNRGKLPIGRHTVRVRECVANRSSCATSVVTVDSIDPATVTYMRMDSTTQGAWRGKYGALGTVSAGLGGTVPFATVTPDNLALIWTWETSTTDVRGLQKPAPADPSDRLAVTWYGQTFSLDLRFTDATAREVAIYAVDWNTTDRVQTIEVLDSQDKVLHTLTTGAELRAGAYYVYRISGHVRIRVTRTAGANGLVFALLFGQ